MSKNGRILVAMSGGIDSSLAAVQLHEQGYEVIGMTMKTWDYATVGGQKKETGCCSLDSIQDARNIAVRMGFPHYVLDIREEFGDFVIDHFTNEYLNARTPNPCVLCNTHIKWEALIKRATKLDCEFIATGHYASLRYENNRYVISKGFDANKDQSYVLWGVSQENLARTKLPLGKYTKDSIRAQAKEYGFKELLEKPESYEICFVPDNDYRGFLKRRIEGLEEFKGGNFILQDGTKVGTHEGYPFYTIGQRKGLGLALGYPVFVIEIRKETNEIVLGRNQELERNSMIVNKINWVKYDALPKNFKVITKIRYKDRGTESILNLHSSEAILTEFCEPVIGIAPGQAAVFYENGDVVAGGWIEKSLR